MSFLRRFFKADKDRQEKGLAADVLARWSWGEPKPLDQKKLLELVEGNDYLRAAIEMTVNACLVNGWIIVSYVESEKKKVEDWIHTNEDDFYMFLRNLITSARIFGEAYVEVYAEPVPKVLDTYTVEVIRDEYGKIVEYIQHAQGRDVRFTPDEIVRVVMHPLGTRAYGSPIIATLRRTLEAQMHAELFVRDAFMRKGVLSKAFILKTGGIDDFERLRDQINQSSPGSSLIVKGDITIQDLGHPFRELEILDLLREYRQKIISVTGVPPILLGLEGGTNLETSRNQINSFVMLVKSIQMIISASVSEVLKRRLGVKNVRFKLIEWMNPEQETRLHVMRVQSGIETINEARKALGLNELDHPIANVPLPFLQMASRGGFTELDLETAIGQLLAQSSRAIPEKSLAKGEDYWDEFDDRVEKLEKKTSRRLVDFFRRVVEDDSPLPVLRQKYDGELKDILRYAILRSALEGVFYLDSMDVAPPVVSVAEEVSEKLLEIFMNDFWAVVADKKAGLIKPSKPSQNYQEIFKQFSEEELYPPQRLDYLNRVMMIVATAVWGAINNTIKKVLQTVRGSELKRDVKVRWVARRDEKTCPMCSSLDGQTWSLDELDSHGFMQPPIHPNCRCRLVVI